MAALREGLDRVVQLGRASLARVGTDEERERWFSAEITRELRRYMNQADADAYQTAGRFDLGWRGIARYLKR